jgi:hypothetical protein
MEEAFDLLDELAAGIFSPPRLPRQNSTSKHTGISICF